MEPIYLGISFIDYLKKLLFTVFSEVFTPILTDILEVFINYFMDVIWSMWSEWLVMLLAAICSLVDFLENIFNVFAGISTVEVHNQHTYLFGCIFPDERSNYSICNYHVNGSGNLLYLYHL